MKLTEPAPESKSALSECAAFADLPAELIDNVFASMRACKFAPGDALMRQNDPGEFLLVIVEGTATGRVRDTSNDETHVIGRFKRGDIVGEMALLTQEPRSADIVADTPVRALMLPADDFHRLVSRHLELGTVLTHVVADRLGANEQDGLGGKVLNGYRILRRVGRGGTSIVYCAEQVDTNQTVALKMMSHRLMYQSGARNRFRQEAEVLGELRHENIAELYGGFAAYNTYFLAMEFCDGPSLGGLTAIGGALDELTVRGLIGQLASALKFLHGHGVLHRDLKPANVMLNKDGRVKLTDFGLAKTDSALTDLTQTPTGQVLGTPRYMAPEQLSGEPADERSDLYGLGCIAYELAAGKRLFKAENLFELIREKSLFSMPGREQISPNLSEELYDVIATGMTSDPAQRKLDLDYLSTWAAPIDLPTFAMLGDDDSPTPAGD